MLEVSLDLICMVRSRMNPFIMDYSFDRNVSSLDICQHDCRDHDDRLVGGFADVNVVYELQPCDVQNASLAARVE